MNPSPRRLPSALLLLTLLAVVLAGCNLVPVGESEEIANVQTVLAGTPSATAAPTDTTTPAPTATHTPTAGPSPTASPSPEPSATAPPTATPLPPTPTPNPALTGFSFCNQQAGSTASLFSARLAEVSASGTPAFEQVVLRFELGDGSAPLGAEAACLSAADLAGAVELAEPYLLRVELPGWLRDERFRASPISGTLDLTGTRTLTSAQLVPGETPDAGAALLIGLSEALPFRLSVERNPTRLVIAVARSSPIVSSSDLLRVPDGSPALDAPLFVISDGEIWRVEAGQAPSTPAPVGEGTAQPVATPLPGSGLRVNGPAAPSNLTESPETETALAVSPDGSAIAFCRAAPGLDPADAELPVPSALWVMDADGGNQRPLGQVGVSCADPAFSLDGATVAFAVDETGATPIQRTIYTVPAAGGQPERLLEGIDEWSRFAPQWLEDDALIFAAAAQDGRSTLFLRSGDEVSDVGAELLAPSGEAPYSGVGRPLAAPDGSRVAVELLRSDGGGADLAILGADGALLELIGARSELPVAPTATGTAATAAAATTGTPATTGTAATAGTTGTPGTARTTATAGTTTPATTGTARTTATASTTTPATTGTTGTPATTGTARTTATAGTTGTPGTARTTATAGTTATAADTPTAAATGGTATVTTPTVTATLAPTLEPEPEPLPRFEGPYWTRPLAWDADGRLIYLSTLCASELVQDYQVYRWAGAQRSELLATGQGFGGVGRAATVGDSLAYLLVEQPQPGPRGPLAAAPRSPAELWLWNLADGGRTPLLTTERDVAALGR